VLIARATERDDIARRLDVHERVVADKHGL